MFQQDKRTTVEVEATRCMKNNKPYRNSEQLKEAKAQAFKAKTGRGKGTILAYVPVSYHDRCACGKALKDQCQGGANGMNNRVKRLRQR